MKNKSYCILIFLIAFAPALLMLASIYTSKSEKAFYFFLAPEKTSLQTEIPLLWLKISVILVEL